MNYRRLSATSSWLGCRGWTWVPWPRSRSTDVALALVFFVGAAAYLSLLPRNLGFSDESYFLYEAKRIRDGEVMYRDLFEFVTPLASYAMAGLFWLFATSIATARIAMAILHALTGVVLYASSRGLGVRRELAFLAPLTYLALCQTAWPYASWHWFSTFFTALLLLALIVGPWASRPRWTFVPGLITGLLICTQQQKGVVLAAGTGVLLLIDFLTDRRYPDRQSGRDLITQLGYFAAGLATILMPVMLAFLLVAGWKPLYDALVRFPLESYRASFRCSWGAIVGPTPAYSYPAVLKYSPLALLLPLVSWIWGLSQGLDRQRVRRLTALIVLSGFSALSIGYFPDAIHIAFIAGIFWVAATEGMRWILSALRPPALSHLACALVLAVLGSSLVLHLVHNARVLSEWFPVSHQTAFGQVDFTSAWEPVFLDRARALLGDAPPRELFCHTELASPYLMIGATNPTPYQYILAGVSPDDQIQQVLRILEARRVQYIIGWAFTMQPTDPIGQYIRDRYERVPIPEIAAQFPVYVLYRRKDGSNTGEGSSRN